MEYGLIGERLGHSFSAEIHKKIGSYEYELCPIPREELSDFMEKKNFRGINVTIPYKKEVMPFLDKIDSSALLCGAVNTVVCRSGRLLGYNTDILGMEYCLRQGGIGLQGKCVAVLGTGGTGGTATALCKKLGAARILRVSREKKEGCVTYDEIKGMPDVQVILNTTPCGMYPDNGSYPVNLDDFPSLEAVFDVIYNPLRTRLMLQAEKKGLVAVGGLRMLVAQAVYAAALFLDQEIPEREIERVYGEILREKENLVLIGMPGSGKSTLGRLLAEKRGKEFFDSDDHIVKKRGISIPEIFRLEGEEGFRKEEAKVISELSKLQNRVIATGGGAILNRENVLNLKQNGRVIFLDAPLESLVATSDRPLSQTPEALKQRFEERYEIYCASCDHKVSVTRDVNENICLIEKELK